MDSILTFQNWLWSLILLAVLAVKAFAFVNSLMFPKQAYEAAGKWHKTGWAIVLGIGLGLSIIPLLGGIIALAFIIAALVYLADVRPALKSLYRRR